MNTLFQLASDRLPHITYLGLTVSPEHWKHFRRKCGEYVLYIIVSGEMYLDEDGHSYTLKQGDAIFLEPGMLHQGTDYSSCTYLYAHFPPSAFHKLLEQTPEEQQALIQNLIHMHYSESPLSDVLYTNASFLFPKHLHMENKAVYDQVLHLAHEAIRKSQSRQVFYKSLTSCYFMEIISLFSAAFMDDWAFHNAQKKMQSTMYEKTSELLDYLHSFYYEKITGSSLEQHFSINFDYLNRIFKKRTGITIFAYLNQIRVDQAKQLLLTTQLSMREIAFQTGFSDEYYFHRMFKKKTGSTPAKYRKAFLATDSFEGFTDS